MTDFSLEEIETEIARLVREERAAHPASDDEAEDDGQPAETVPFDLD
jgi:hypothetical protein